MMLALCLSLFWNFLPWNLWELCLFLHTLFFLFSLDHKSLSVRRWNSHLFVPTWTFFSSITFWFLITLLINRRMSCFLSPLIIWCSRPLFFRILWFFIIFALFSLYFFFLKIIDLVFNEFTFFISYIKLYWRLWYTIFTFNTCELDAPLRWSVRDNWYIRLLWCRLLVIHIRWLITFRNSLHLPVIVWWES